MKNTHKNGVSKKKEEEKNRMKKGQNIENPSNFKLDCLNCYIYIFSSTFVMVVL